MVLTPALHVCVIQLKPLQIHFYITVYTSHIIQSTQKRRETLIGCAEQGWYGDTPKQIILRLGGTSLKKMVAHKIETDQNCR